MDTSPTPGNSDRTPSQPTTSGQDEQLIYDGPFMEYTSSDESAILQTPQQPASPQPGPYQASPPHAQPYQQPIFPPPAPPGRRRVVIGAVSLILVLALLLSGGYIAWYYLQPSPKTAFPGLPGTATALPQLNSAFTQQSCPFELGKGIKEGSQVKCGYLTVPEDYAKPDGKKIKLAVAIFTPPGDAAKSRPPFFYLTGGPGGTALGDLGSYIDSTNLDSITLGRQLVLFDQRGAGYSQPSLDCLEMDQLDKETRDQQLSEDEANKRYIEAGQKCRDRLTQSGVNLATYTTINNATDVHSLIQALGYKQVDLYGVSYGTRLALTVMRLFPGELHSVTLDSTVPLQTNLFENLPGLHQHAFDTFFKGCSEDTSCQHKYPELERTFYSLVDRWNQQPESIKDAKEGTFLVDGNGLVNWLFSALYVTQFIPMLPQVIEQLDQGDTLMFTSMYTLLFANQNMSEGMYYSIMCGEDMAYTTQQKLIEETQKLHPPLNTLLMPNTKYDYEICKVWNQPAVPSEQKQPVKSQVPTLILAGEYDPITPPSQGEMAHSTLPKSTFLVFPGTGHGVFMTNICPMTIMNSFMSNPERTPSSSCLRSVPEPPFI